MFYRSTSSLIEESCRLPDDSTYCEVVSTVPLHSWLTARTDIVLLTWVPWTSQYTVKELLKLMTTNMLAISAMERIANEKPKSETRYIHTMPARPPLGRIQLAVLFQSVS